MMKTNGVVMGLWGPCRDPTPCTDGVGRARVIKSGVMGWGRGCLEIRSERRVGLFGAIAGAEVFAHLLKGESALGDIGRAQTTAGVALDEALGEEKVGYAFPPDLDVLLGSEPLWTAVDKAETVDAESVAGVAGAIVVADFITFLAANSAGNATLFGAFALLLDLCSGELGGSERATGLCGPLRRRDGGLWLALGLGDHGGGVGGGGRSGVREEDNRGYYKYSRREGTTRTNDEDDDRGGRCRRRGSGR
jgi:hypothetical protein